MPASLHRITPDDIIPDAEFARQRKARRAALMPMKALRRVALGPYCTFYFECFDTMLFQVQEMLLVEKGGEAQLADELEAYNPLIPKGSELVATVMFEIEDPVRRDQFLGQLGGVEEQFFIQIGLDRIWGTPEGDISRTREDGKTSAVHFLRFTLSGEDKAAFGEASSSVMIGCEHHLYAHMAVLSPATLDELARDFE